MPVRLLRETEILEMLNDSKMSDDLIGPRKCRKCEQTLVARIEEGRLVHACPVCDDKMSGPVF